MTTSRIFVVFSVLFICSALAFYLRPQHKTYSAESIKIHGFNLVAPRSSFSPDSLLKVKATGAEWGALVPYSFCNPATAEVSFNHERQWWGERPEGIKAVLMAQAIGLKSIDYSTAGHLNIYKYTLGINFEAQNTVFSALNTSLNHKEWWQGGFIWKWHLTKNGQSNRTIKAYTPQDKPAMESISKYFNSNQIISQP